MKLYDAGVRVAFSIVTGKGKYPVSVSERNLKDELFKLPFVNEIDDRCTGYVVVLLFDDMEQANKEIEQAKKNVLDFFNA